MTVLKCRTPGEAFLVADELEAADILVIVPEEKELFKEFKCNGFVSIRVSSKSYEAAKELRTIIETKHWDDRAKQRLSIPMTLAAIGLGLMPVPGIVFFLTINEAHKNKGYGRKAQSFRRWFLVGCALAFILIVILSK